MHIPVKYLQKGFYLIHLYKSPHSCVNSFICPLLQGAAQMYIGAISSDLHFKKSFASCTTFKETEECFLLIFLGVSQSNMVMGGTNWPSGGDSPGVQQHWSPLVPGKSRKIQTSLKARRPFLLKKGKNRLFTMVSSY